METISALGLLLVGMLTVFVILALVVMTGNLVIKFVNRFMPPPPSLAKNSSLSVSQSPSQVAAIVAAVDIFTTGKGNVKSIKKME